MWQAKINRVINGFVLETPLEVAETEKSKTLDEFAKYALENYINPENRIQVFSEVENSETSDLFAARDLLYTLCEEFGINTSRKRPYIRIKVLDENENELELTSSVSQVKSFDEIEAE